MSIRRWICDRDAQMEHSNQPCSREGGRVRGVILFDTSFDINSLITNLQAGASGDYAVVNAIKGGIAAGKVHIINQTTGSYNGGSSHTVDGYMEGEKRVLWKEHELKIKDPTYYENCSFWELATSRQFYVAWRTETLLHFTDQPVNVVAEAPTDEDLNSVVVWDATLTWKSKKHPIVVQAETIALIMENDGVPAVDNLYIEGLYDGNTPNTPLTIIQVGGIMTGAYTGTMSVTRRYNGGVLTATVSGMCVIAKRDGTVSVIRNGAVIAQKSDGIWNVVYTGQPLAPLFIPIGPK